MARIESRLAKKSCYNRRRSPPLSQRHRWILLFCNDALTIAMIYRILKWVRIIQYGCWFATSHGYFAESVIQTKQIFMITDGNQVVFVKRWFVLYEQQRLMNILQMLLQIRRNVSQKITHPLSLPFMIANDLISV
jgi:hypothetical protein